MLDYRQKILNLRCQTPGNWRKHSIMITMVYLSLLILAVLLYLIYNQSVAKNEKTQESKNKYNVTDGKLDTSHTVSDMSNTVPCDIHDKSRFFALSYRVKGSYYRSSSAVNLLAIAEIGDKVTLKKEPLNQYDEYAIKVLLDGKHIGYIEQEESYSIFQNFQYIVGAEISKIIESNVVPYINIDIYFPLDCEFPAVLSDERIIDGVDSPLQRLMPKYPQIIKAERLKIGRPNDALKIFLDIAEDDDTEIYPEYECVKIYRKLKQYKEEICVINKIISELEGELTSLCGFELQQYEFEINRLKERKDVAERMLSNKIKKEQERQERILNPKKRGRKPKNILG